MSLERENKPLTPVDAAVPAPYFPRQPSDRGPAFPVEAAESPERAEASAEAFSGLLASPSRPWGRRRRSAKTRLPVAKNNQALGL